MDEKQEEAKEKEQAEEKAKLEEKQEQVKEKEQWGGSLGESLESCSYYVQSVCDKALG
jgi:hypothetical protein